MLVEALIHHEFEEAAKAVQGFSVQDCLFQARMVKADKRYTKTASTALVPVPHGRSAFDSRESIPFYCT